MSTEIDDQLNSMLKEAHAIEKQAMQLLEKAPDLAGDNEIGAIYRAHKLQTEEHARYVGERLEARGESPSKLKDTAMQGVALGLGTVLQAASKTPVRLATVAFAFENLEVASYRLIRRLAEQAGDTETVSVADRVLEQEEAAAELIAGTFERALQVTLGEQPTAPVPSVTPIGKPSERGEGLSSEHPGPQEAKEKDQDEPVTQPADISEPTEADHLRSPDPGHPAGETKPYGGDVPPRDAGRREDRRNRAGQGRGVGRTSASSGKEDLLGRTEPMTSDCRDASVWARSGQGGIGSSD